MESPSPHVTVVDPGYAPNVGSILVVEADRATSEEWSAAIIASGHDVLVAVTTREALPLIQEGGIDAVVIDTSDPRDGVIELARGIEALPDAPPVILVSGSPQAPEISVRIAPPPHLFPSRAEPAEVVAAQSRGCSSACARSGSSRMIPPARRARVSSAEKCLRARARATCSSTSTIRQVQSRVPSGVHARVREVRCRSVRERRSGTCRCVRRLRQQAPVVRVVEKLSKLFRSSWTWTST